ncbi:unnamed protein product [Periconia digitata]|uniref:Uncharacterized protein n=1 Tax=Periconia digitata TaxID=1303443 RepID=A0A9W4UMJ4_9PLEO|nr:unnamed protein product [Periconia digitata]
MDVCIQTARTAADQGSACSRVFAYRVTVTQISTFPSYASEKTSIGRTSFETSSPLINSCTHPTRIFFRPILVPPSIIQQYRGSAALVSNVHTYTQSTSLS